MEQTAVEWLYDKMYIHKGNITITEYEQANEKFEQQIIDAFDHGDLVGRSSLAREISPNDKVVLKYPEISAEEYYKKTFKSK